MLALPRPSGAHSFRVSTPRPSAQFSETCRLASPPLRAGPVLGAHKRSTVRRVGPGGTPSLGVMARPTGEAGYVRGYVGPACEPDVYSARRPPSSSTTPGRKRARRSENSGQAPARGHASIARVSSVATTSMRSSRPRAGAAPELRGVHGQHHLADGNGHGALDLCLLERRLGTAHCWIDGRRRRQQPVDEQLPRPGRR